MRLLPHTTIFSTLLMSLLVSNWQTLTCHAYTPTLGTTSDTTRRSSMIPIQQQQRIHVQPHGRNPNMELHRDGLSTTSQLYLSNGFFLDRVTRVVKSNMNKLVSNIENPEKVINQAVIDMQVCW